MENFTPADIEKICNKMQFKYCELTSQTKKYGGYNQTPGKLKEKINSIKKFLQELPDDIYYLNCKIFPKGDIFTYKFNKGNLSESTNVTPQIFPVYNSTPLEKFQTLDEWKKQEKTINDLQQEIAFLKMQAKFADTLKEEPKEEKQNAILGFAENVLPQFMPILDRYFNIKEKELEIKAKPKQDIKQPAAKIFKKFRPLPEITDEINLQKYLVYFMNLPDLAAEQELVYVNTQNANLYNLLISKFYEDEKI